MPGPRRLGLAGRCARQLSKLPPGAGGLGIDPPLSHGEAAGPRPTMTAADLWLHMCTTAGGSPDASLAFFTGHWAGCRWHSLSVVCPRFKLPVGGPMMLTLLLTRGQPGATRAGAPAAASLPTGRPLPPVECPGPGSGRLGAGRQLVATYDQGGY